ncbi:glycosyltransferase family 2 protein [Citrobacter sp. BNK-39]|nr:MULTISPECIES: glycosyltransferase family 2 protein [Citrobacter freundii complex]EGS5520915.1 glycosyltransferase [Citrobacter freundii]MCY3417796.1 glycosyltransferase [Citrobacter freundii]MDE9608709.1 glycosyltransferase [Citrobacter portucalensis]OIY03384.1 hypothetical protein BED42_24025 [Citrobacter portucalensis]QMF87422.1 glycosyltransferase [Citrobacter freundii]
MEQYLKVSLIGTTQGGRNSEIKRLLKSINESDSKSFLELVFVDQSDDEQISNVFENYKDKINYKIIKSKKISLSKARNLALRNCAGDIIGFCDDDAFYSPVFFKKLMSLDVKNNCIISVPVIDFQTETFYANRKFPNKSKKLSYNGIIKFSLSVGTFIFKNKNQIFEFDERLGVGTVLGGSEETELFFRLKHLGYDVIYQPLRGVYHDNDIPTGNLPEKYRKYAVGYGVVIKKYIFKSHFTLILEIIRLTIKSFAGMCLKKQKKLYISRLIGFWTGLIKYGI